MPVQPSPAEIISRALESRLNDLYGPMPAIVVSFDPGGPGAAPAVDVQPVVQRALPVDDDGTLAPEPLPVVPNVPILYPSGAGVQLTWALAPGDVVLLVPLMLAITQWRLTGVPIVAPTTDQALHHIANCVAIPCLKADAFVTTPVDLAVFAVETTAMRIGSTGAPTALTVEAIPAGIALGSALATDFAALASRVDDQLTKIAASLASISPPPGTPYIFPDVPPNDTVACTKVKIE